MTSRSLKWSTRTLAEDAPKVFRRGDHPVLPTIAGSHDERSAVCATWTKVPPFDGIVPCLTSFHRGEMK
jgi:hypothetical protein